MPSHGEDQDDRDYFVVVNDEEQYSIWPAERDVPAGWTTVGDPAKKADCLNHIEEVWTDMRPRSLRDRMEARAADPTASNTD